MSYGSKSDDVPVVNIPKDDRIDRLSDVFVKEFNNKPTFFVRVPGRVNIIGEHIDYCGYPVLPMAVEQDILIAAGITEQPVLSVCNTNPKYENFTIKINNIENFEINPDSNGKPYWYNYVLCGIKGALEHLRKKCENGVQLCVDGNIPPASGLSSSSALVSAACLSFLHAENAQLNKTEIAALCAKCERYIGTQGGGMDQAIAFLGEKYSAQYITFKPTLKATAVALPEDATFVVAHSLAEANKAATNDFNRRVIECRLAAKILAVLSEIIDDTNKIITLSEVQKLLQNDLDEMITLVIKHLPKDIYTKDEISRILGISEEDMNEVYMTPNTKHLTEFKLKQRALHVYEEAKRVEDFRKFCTSSSGKHSTDQVNGTNKVSTNGNGLSNDTLEVLGKLMSASHDSLRKLYECSHENLDLLVDISRSINIHSRLTGAGWGGCAVALCPTDKVDEYIETLKEQFYEKHCKVNKEEASKYVFASTPNHGARVYQDNI